LKSFIDK